MTDKNLGGQIVRQKQKGRGSKAFVSCFGYECDQRASEMKEELKGKEVVRSLFESNEGLERS